MKILHLMLACFYIDNYSYQENYLPKYHKRAGHEVEIVASLVTFDQNGNGALLPHADHYVNEHGIPVTRLDYAKKPFSGLLRTYRGLEGELERFAPDVIFLHGLQFSDISKVVRYVKRHPGVTVYADNHSDFSNSARNWVSRWLLHGILWRHCAKRIEPYVKKFYGVLPARVDFLADVYHLPRERIELLVMGTDDEAVQAAADPGQRSALRRQYGIAEEDFLIMNGGKIDLFKKQTLLLMDAVNALDDPRVKLIVFGSIIPELQDEVAKRCSDRVQYIGWIQAADSYRYFAACDLACFPGRHSVFWEQVVGQGIPLLVKRWEGTTHVDVCGNVRFLEQDTVGELTEALRALTEPEAYASMKQAAAEASRHFMYSDIARRSIEE